MSKGALIGGGIGFVLFGPQFAFIGVPLGALIGHLINPDPLFGEESTRAKLGSIEPNLADEGTPITYSYGRHCRVGAQLIYASDMWVVETVEGGGKRGEQTTQTYYADAIYTAAWNAIFRFSKIRFDADVVYLANPAASVSLRVGPTNTQIVVFQDEQNNLVRWIWNEGTQLWELVGWTLTIENHPTNGPNGGPLFVPQLARYIVGEDATVWHLNASGQSVAANNNIVSIVSSVPRNITGKVIDSRVTGIGTNGVQNTRLVVDLSNYINLVNAAFGGLGTSPFVHPGTGAPPNGAPPKLASLTGGVFTGFLPVWPLMPQPFLPGASLILVDQDGSQFVPEVMDPDLTELRNGSLLPGPSSLYESRVGTGKAPALPRVSMFAAAAVKTSRFGNRYPTATLYVDENWQSPGVERQTDYILQTLFSTHGGIPSTLLNLTTHTPKDFLGINFAGTQPISQVIAPVLIGFDLHLEESDFQIKVKDRLSRDQIPVDHGHLDARPKGSQTRPKLTFQSVAENQLPRRLHIQFIDRDKDLDDGDAQVVRDQVGGAENDVTRQLTLPYTMHQNEAKAIARRLLRDGYDQSDSVTFRLPARYSYIAESDILVMTAATTSTGLAYLGRDFYVMVTRIDIGADFFIDGEGIIIGELPTAAPTIEEDEVFVDGEDTGAGLDVGSGERETLRRPSPFFMASMDVAALTDEDAQKCGFYIMGQKAHAFDSANGHLYRQLSGGDAWHHMQQVGALATIGRLKTPMPPGVYGVFNYSDSIDVEVVGDVEFTNTLQSATEAEVRAGANLCAIGASSDTMEILAFTTVTDLTNPDSATNRSARRFRLSGFLRGLLGTDNRINTHATAGDDFILLRPGSMQFIPQPLALVGTNQSFKIVPGGVAKADGHAERLTIAGNSSLSAPVANLAAQRMGSGDIDFSWLRRTRARHRVLGSTDGPLLEVTESYDVVINPATTNRTINVSTTAGTYTAAQQSDDSTTDAELAVHVYQLDSVRGRGRVAILAVPALAATWQDENGSDDLITEDGRNLMTEN